MIQRLLVPALLLAACGEPAVVDGVAVGSGGRGAKGDRVSIDEDWTGDVVSTTLTVDLAGLSATATIAIETSAATASFETGGLQVLDVYSGQWAVEWEVSGGAVHVELPDGPGKAELSFDYTFRLQDPSEGFSEHGSTIVWPKFCGNLFPCRTAPGDGQTFSLDVQGVPPGLTAIYPDRIDQESPTYMIAWAVGDYACEILGHTGAGTEVSVCWLPKGKTKALSGTRDLVEVMDWLETNLGAYAFGDEVASIAAEWGDGAAGGMEHHPWWHVATSEMGVPITHAHEAVHGWYGNGVRLQCWEDFVLSEGTTSYLAARALGAVTDLETEEAIWADYEEELNATLEDEDIIVWPHSDCSIDLLDDGLFSNTVYMKGAFFFREVAEAVGAEVLDGVLAGFYSHHLGRAATMRDLLDVIEADTGFEVDGLVEKWLRSKGNPL